MTEVTLLVEYPQFLISHLIYGAFWVLSRPAMFSRSRACTARRSTSANFVAMKDERA
jgi:hypothetical protein